MSLSHLALLAALASNAALGVAVYLTNTRRVANQHFLTLSVVITIWIGCIGAAFTSNAPATADFWIRQASAGCLFVPLAFEFLLLALTQPSASWFQIIRQRSLFMSACIAIGFMCQTPFFLREVVVRGTQIPEPAYGPGFALFNAWFLGSCVVVVIRYVRTMLRAEGIVRAELQFVVLGWALCSLVGAGLALIIPIFVGDSRSVQFAPLCVILLDLIIAYGIATRRIMDVPNLLRRITAYVLLTGYLSALYFAVWFIIAKLAVHVDIAQHSMLPNVMAALAVAFSVAPMHGRMQQFANRLFVNVRALDVSDTIQRANRILSSIATLDDLLAQFSDNICKAIGSDQIRILLADADRFTQRYPKATSDAPTTLTLDDPILVSLRHDREPLVRDVLQRIQPSPLLADAKRRMSELNTAIAIAIESKARVEGVMLLGPRLSGRIYGAQEQRVLQILCNNLAVAIENAKLYTQVQDSAIYNNILLDNLVSGVVAINEARIITVFNREAQRITRLDAASVLGQDISRLPAPLAQALNATFENAQGRRDQEVQLRVGPGDEHIPTRLGTTLFHSHTGKVLGALLVFSDLSTLRKLEQQVRRTDRLASLGTLSAGMAHEIKNPLVTLKTFTQLLPERYEDPDFRDTFSSLLGQEVKRIDSLVNQLLRFARPAKPSLAPLHLHQVVENTLKLVHQQLRQKNIALKLRLEAASDLISGDHDLLVQALLNLLLNAIDALEKSGALLEIDTAVIEQESTQFNLWGQIITEPHIRLSIRDSGNGIRPEDVPHIFDPFFTTKSTGTGLGLSVAHGIIHEHHGLVDVESKLGVGTTFHLIFPLTRKEAPV